MGRGILSVGVGVGVDLRISVRVRRLDVVARGGMRLGRGTGGEGRLRRVEERRLLTERMSWRRVRVVGSCGVVGFVFKRGVRVWVAWRSRGMIDVKVLISKLSWRRTRGRNMPIYPVVGSSEVNM